MIPFLIRVGAVALLGWVLYRLFLSGGGATTNAKCAGCIHRGRLDEDGVLCRFGQRETFKNSVHIANCTDFESR